MTRDLLTFLVPALVVFAVGIFCLLLLAPLWIDLRWRCGRRGRGGRYIR